MLNLTKQNALHKECTHAPMVAACPRCGTFSPRNEVKKRSFWMPDLEQPTVFTINMSCYICPWCSRPCWR